MNLMISNYLFKKKENQFVTYESGGVESVIDYILTRVSDRNAALNIKTILGEQCVRQHRLLIAVCKECQLKEIQSMSQN